MKIKVILTINVVLVLWIAQLTKANIVDSNSIVKDGIEYYMQTDKSIYDLEENVEMLYRVTNMGDKDVTFEFICGPADDRCDFMVDKDEERIWDNLNRSCLWVITSFTLSSFESKEFSWSWDMIDLNDNQVIPGKYGVSGVLSDLGLAYSERYVPVCVPIEIIPEPATFLLLGLGGLFLRKKRYLAL